MHILAKVDTAKIQSTEVINNCTANELQADGIDNESYSLDLAKSVGVSGISIPCKAILNPCCSPAHYWDAQKMVVSWPDRLKKVCSRRCHWDRTGCVSKDGVDPSCGEHIWQWCLKWNELCERIPRRTAWLRLKSHDTLCDLSLFLLSYPSPPDKIVATLLVFLFPSPLLLGLPKV